MHPGPGESVDLHEALCSFVGSMELSEALWELPMPACDSMGLHGAPCDSLWPASREWLDEALL